MKMDIVLSEKDILNLIDKELVNWYPKPYSLLLENLADPCQEVAIKIKVRQIKGL